MILKKEVFIIRSKDLDDFKKCCEGSHDVNFIAAKEDLDGHHTTVTVVFEHTHSLYYLGFSMALKQMEKINLKSNE